MKPRHVLYGGAAALALFIASVLQTREDISYAFCAELGKKSSYKEGLEQYAFLVQGKDNWIFRSDRDFRTDFSVSSRTTANLLRLQEAFRSNGVDLVIVFPPPRGLTQARHLLPAQLEKFYPRGVGAAWLSYENMISFLQAEGLGIIGMAREQSPSFFYYRRDHHWTPHGAKAMAERTAETVKRFPAYAAVPRARFATEKSGVLPVNSSFEKAFARICGTILPTEKSARYLTRPTATAMTEADILGEGKAPEIVLLGTSNSLQESAYANFEGFLKESLSADILNLSHSGAGIDTSILAFLNSDLFRDRKIKIAIWEVPGYYDFNVMDENILQQVIPAAYGPCGKYPLLSKSLRLVPRERTLLFDESDLMREEQQKRYISLVFTERVSHPLSLRFHFAEGTKRIVFDRDEGSVRNSIFHALFPSTASPIAKVTLEGTQDASLSAMICKLP